MKKKGVRRAKVYSIPAHNTTHSEAVRTTILVSAVLLGLLVVGILIFFPGSSTKISIAGKAGQQLLPAQCVVPPSNSLLAWWKGEKLESESGGYALTKAGNFDPIVVLQGNPLGNAFNFPVGAGGGEAGRYLQSTSPSLKVTGAFTISAWVYPQRSPQGVGRVVASTYAWNNGGQNQRGWTLGTEYGNRDFFAFTVSDQNGQRYEAKMDNFYSTFDQSWVHVVGVFIPNQKVELYVNKQLISSSASAPAQIAYNPATPFRIGHRADHGSQGMWNGYIDEVALFQGALSSDEITKIHEADQGLCTCRADNRDDFYQEGNVKLKCNGAGSWIRENSEICNDGQDNNANGKIDCADASCSTNAECRGRVCAENKVVTWSYKILEENEKRAASEAPLNYACCLATQCSFTQGGGNGGFDIGCKEPGAYSPGAPFNNNNVLCAADQNWYSCSEQLLPEQRVQGAYRCVQEDEQWKWDLLCSPDVKYKLKDQNQKVCDGRRWRECPDATGIPDPNIEITCAGVDNKVITIKERICNNALDDDKDQKTDALDPDCSGPLSYSVGAASNRLYEVTTRPDEGPVTIHAEER